MTSAPTQISPAPKSIGSLGMEVGTAIRAAILQQTHIESEQLVFSTTPEDILDKGIEAAKETAD